MTTPITVRSIVAAWKPELYDDTHILEKDIKALLTDIIAAAEKIPLPETPKDRYDDTMDYDYARGYNAAIDAIITDIKARI